MTLQNLNVRFFLIKKRNIPLKKYLRSGMQSLCLFMQSRTIKEKGKGNFVPILPGID